MDAGLLSRATRSRPVNERSWARLQARLADLDRFQATPGRTAAELDLIESCRARIEMAARRIDRGHARTIHAGGLRGRLAAWARRLRQRAAGDDTLVRHLVRSVDEDLLLLLPVREVAARGLEIESLFTRDVRRPAARRARPEHGRRRGSLAEAVRVLAEAAARTAAPAEPESAKVRCARQMLRWALHEVNERRDYGFRRLAVDMLMRS